MRLSVFAARPPLCRMFSPKGLVQRISSKKTIVPVCFSSSTPREVAAVSHDICSGRSDFQSFKPPPAAIPLRPEELAKDLPFEYWYSYADLPPDAPKRRRRYNPALFAEAMRRWDPSYLEKLAAESDEGDGEELWSSNTNAFADRISSVRLPKTNERMPKTRPKSNTFLATDAIDCRNKLQTWESVPDTNVKEAKEFFSNGSSKISNGTRNAVWAGSGKQIPKGNLAKVDDDKNKRHPSDVEKVREDRDIGESEALSMTNRNNMMGLENGKLIDDRHVDYSDNNMMGLDNSEASNLTSSEKGTVLMSSKGNEDQEVGLLGEEVPLTKKEVSQMVYTCDNSRRQINIGWAGWTENYVLAVHSYWRKAPICKIKCKGLPTLDMGTVCRTLEEKTGGKVVRRVGGSIYLFRGRNYDSRDGKRGREKKRHVPNWVNKRLPIPKMLTPEDVLALRARGRDLPALCKPCENGVFLTLLDDVRTALRTQDLVRINCQTYNPKHLKALGAKLQELVPCKLISYEFEHILMWKGKEENSLL